jgi:predicted metal-dependent phosphoesterase TrpH
MKSQNEVTRQKEPREKPREKLSSEQVEQLKSEGVITQPEQVASPQTMRIDLHCHTEASPDSITPLEFIPARCAERGIQVQAITDHECIWGAQKLQNLVEQDPDIDLTVIVGEEISTSQGELVGLFLKEAVPAGLTPLATVEAIQQQGGLVLLPHGFDPLRLPRLQDSAREALVESIDIVETFNARISRPHWNRVAARWSQTHGLLKSAGTDAHTLADIGSAWVEVPKRPIQGPDDLLKALEGGVPVGKWTHPAIAYVYKLWDRLRYKLKTLFS